MASVETSPATGSGPSSEAHPPSARRTSLLDVTIILARKKLQILKTTAAIAVLAAIVSLLLPSRYTAAVTLLPPQQNSSLASAFTSQLGNLGSLAIGGALGLKNPNDMFVAMLNSRTVEDGVIQQFGLMKEYRAKYLSDARKSLEKHATIKNDELSGLIKISVEDSDPKRAAAIANGFVDQFRGLSAHLAISEASQRRLFFEQQLEQAKDSLANAEQDLKKTEQKTGVIQFEGQARVLIESAASLQAQINAKEVQIQSLKAFATDQNAQLVVAQRELDGLRSELAKISGRAGSEADGLIAPKGQVSEAGLEYMRKLRDVKYYETIFDILAKQYELAKLDEARQGSLIQVVDPAIPPDKRSFPRRSLIVLGAAIGGFLVAVLWALLGSGYEQSQSDPEVRYKLDSLRTALRFRRKVT